MSESEYQIVRDAIGLNNRVTILNDETRNVTFLMTGKYVGQSRNVMVIDIEYRKVDEAGNTDSGQMSQDSEQTAIEITGKELGDFPDTEEGKKNLRDKAMDVYRNKLINSDGVYCLALKDKVLFDEVGINKVRSFSADARKLRMIPFLDEIIRNGQELQIIDPSDKAARRGIKQCYVLKTPITLDGEKLKVRLVIHLKMDGTYSYDHAVDSEEGERGAGGSSGAMDSVDATDHGLPVLQLGEPSPRHTPHDGNIPNKHDPFNEEIILDSVAGNGMVFNLFIEGEEPEYVDKLEPEPNHADRALFQSVIDGTVKTADGEGILSPQLADDMEAAFYRNQGDTEMESLFEQAVNAYQDAMLAATADIK